MDVDELSNKIIGLAIKVHSALGPDLLESTYKECLYYEIMKSGFSVEKEKALPLLYEEVKLDIGYRVDILVENILVVETKAIESFTNVHLARTLTYLKLGHFKLGLLMNFNVKLLKDGIKRVIN
jgi:GxxExxY protein